MVLNKTKKTKPVLKLTSNPLLLTIYNMNIMCDEMPRMDGFYAGLFSVVCCVDPLFPLHKKIQGATLS